MSGATITSVRDGSENPPRDEAKNSRQSRPNLFLLWEIGANSPTAEGGHAQKSRCQHAHANAVHCQQPAPKNQHFISDEVYLVMS